MHEELKIEEVTPMSKVEECIFQLNTKLIATITNKKIKKNRNKKRSWKTMCPSC